MADCVLCATPVGTGCELCTSPLCSSCFQATDHGMICVGDPLPSLTEEEKASIVFRYYEQGRQSDTFLPFLYGYKEILKRLRILKLDPKGFERDVQRAITDLREAMAVVTDRMVKHPDKFSSRLRATTVAELPYELSHDYLNYTVPMEDSTRYISFLFEWTLLIEQMQDPISKVIIQAHALRKWVSDSEFVKYLLPAHILFAGDRLRVDIDNDPEFARAKAYFADWIYGEVEAENGNYKGLDRLSVAVVYKEAVKNIDESRYNLRQKDYDVLKPVNAEYFTIRKGTYMYRASSADRMRKDRVSTIWFALDKLTTIPYTVPFDAPKDMSTTGDFCRDGLGGIKVYAAKTDISLINISTPQNVRKLTLMLKKADQKVQDAFKKTVWLDVDGTVRRNSYSELDKLWADWLCANTDFHGYGAPAIGSFHAELMICDPWNDTEYVGAYTAGDMGVEFCDYGAFHNSALNPL